MKLALKLVLTGAYILVIILANWSIQKWGVVSIGFGLMAPAGVYFAGLAFSVRDGLHETSNKYWIIAAIIIGAGVSYILEDGVKVADSAITTIAVASGVAFLLSELADFAIYSPLRNRGKIKALLASNAVGLLADSMLFLYLAFGSLEFLRGQVVAKAYMTLAVVGLMFCYRLYKRSLAK